MLDVEITGDEHPKKVVLVNDESAGDGPLNADLMDQFREADFEELADSFGDNPLSKDGKLRVEVPTDWIGEVIDFLQFELEDQPATQKLEAMRQEAFAKAEEAIQGD